MKKVYLIAVIVALIAGSATYLFASSLMKNSSIEDAPTQEVLFAVADIPEGTQILAEDIETMFVQKKVVEQDLTPNAVTSAEAVVGQVVAQKIYEGEQLSMNRFIESGGDNAALSYTLSEGECAYSIKAEADKGVDGYIKPGDTVDIIACYPEDEKSKTVMEFTNLKVLKVATYQDVKTAQSEMVDGEVVTYVSITVKTNDAQAVQLFNMENTTSGDFKVVLNSRIDAEKAE